MRSRFARPLPLQGTRCLYVVACWRPMQGCAESSPGKWPSSRIGRGALIIALTTLIATALQHEKTGTDHLFQHDRDSVNRGKRGLSPFSPAHFPPKFTKNYFRSYANTMFSKQNYFHRELLGKAPRTCSSVGRSYEQGRLRPMHPSSLRLCGESNFILVE
jgi:hypothetical protein